MQSAAQSYDQTAKVTENPREREAVLLVKAARELQKARDEWKGDAGLMREALIFNRKLWTIFMSSVANEENPLPLEIKNNIANLGVFILGRTLDATMEPDPDKLASLISINQNVAAGLRGNA